MDDYHATYVYEEFVEACRRDLMGKGKVTIDWDVRETAEEDFGLLSRRDILLCIVNGACESMEFENSHPYWKSDERPRPICDAYTFFIGSTLGYISFFYSDHKNQWSIKSFHRSSRDLELYRFK